MVKLQLVDLDSVLKVSRRASRLNGTTASLRDQDLLTLQDVLHGMMLPSGNDAAYCIAENLGTALLEITTRPSKSSNVEVFVKHMNRLAVQLGLQQSTFCNPHGLAHKGNVSTARDLGRLAAYLLNDELASSIVNCRDYSCVVSRHGVQRELSWSNTNLLLEEPGFTGLKTGNTPTAGPCLCASFQLKDLHLIVVLLQCRSPEHRWSEAKRLLSWACKQTKSNWS
jgi:D-alanyl-D-alanine carboxypeptidase